MPEYQRRGIGAYLISLLETIGKATQMEKVMLTVFKGNWNRLFAGDGSCALF